MTLKHLIMERPLETERLLSLVIELPMLWTPRTHRDHAS